MINIVGKILMKANFFTLDLILTGGSHKKLEVSKVARVPISKISRFPT
jgi:hypothetical protein